MAAIVSADLKSVDVDGVRARQVELISRLKASPVWLA
jgi:hypothetical protein